jgi:predicted permease
MNSQFRTLVAHFFSRFFDAESTSADADVRARMIQYLALLSVPGVMLSFFMMADHPATSVWVRAAFSEADRLWLRVGDRYVFVSYAMVVMGLLMTFKWDSLFPDRRDYLILTSLPISSRRWFSSKVLALCAFLALFAVAINVFSLLLVPRQVAEQSKVVSPTVFWEAMLAHAAGTIGGSIFAALFFGALQGVLINILTPQAFKRISPRIQMVSIGVLVTLLLVTPLVKDGIPSLAQNESPILDYFPAMWFLGLYEALIPGGSLMPRSIVWAYTALEATLLVAILFALSYTIGYWRYSRKILESVDSETMILRWWHKAANSFLDRTLLRNPVQRGTFHFIEKISRRSSKHRILTGLYIGIGIALAVSSLFVIDRNSASPFPFRLSARGALEAPLILAFVMISGLRATFNVPSELNANWMFQTAGDATSPHFLKSVRKWVFLYRIVPLFGLVALFEFVSFDATTAVFHLTFDLVAAAFLIEAFFFKFNKVPFTCSYTANKFQLIAVAAAYLFGFTTYVVMTGGLKRTITTSTFRMAIFLSISAVVFAILRKGGGPKRAIVYQEDEPTFLSLTDDAGYWRNNSPPKLGGVARSAGVVPHEESRPRNHSAFARFTRKGTPPNLGAELVRGARILWKSPGISATAVILIALVIGGNTTIFSMVHAFISRPAPGVHRENLVMLGIPATRAEPFHSYMEYLDFVAQSKTLSTLIAYGPERITFNTQNGTSAFFGAYVTSNYFQGLGVELARGRSFIDSDNRLDIGGLAAVISYRIWQEQFQGAEDVLGRSVTVNGHPATIVGVAAEHYQGAELGIPEDIWVPAISYFTIHGRQRMLNDRADPNRPFAFIVLGQLAPGVSLAQAQAEFATISSRLQAAYPLTNKDKVIRPIRYTATNNAGISHGAPQFLAVFSVITALTLVIVCANVANLLLARAVVRHRETALRQALGASRSRILCMLIGEGMAISITAWAAASGFAVWISRFAPRFVESQATNGLGMRSNLMHMDLSPDLTVLAYAMLLALIGTVFFTMAPALRTWSQQLLPGLKSGEHSIVRGRSKLASGLVVTQLAFSVVLLTGAGLARRSLSLIEDFDLGFNTDNLLLVTVNPSLSITNRDVSLALLEQLRERLYNTPGVEAVSYVRLPMAISWRREPIRPPGSQTPLTANINYVGPDYLRVHGVAPIFGRDFTAADGSPSAKTAIVNQNLAAALWPGQPALGQTIPLERGKDYAEVIGIAPNVSFSGSDYPYLILLSEQQDRTRITGQAGLLQSGETTLYIRHNRSLEVIAPSIRRIVREVDKRIPIVYMRTMNTQLESSRTGARTVAAFLSLFSGASLLIAALGQYAAIAFEMKRRTREFGIRVAMGASASQIQSSVLREGLVLTGIGLLIGFGLSAVVGLALRGVLTSVSPTDARTYLGVFALLAAASLAACYMPARRAARVDPLVTLRYE